ncbi:MAG: HAMP domain-containing histidine kinase [Firmicutes bacterium]|nr:HAMP domain-containing histidine kinase [Bacillota bacterium]
MSKTDWTKSFWAKAAAFAIAVILVPVIVVNGVALFYGLEDGWWSAAPDARHSALVTEAVYQRMSDVVGAYRAEQNVEFLSEWYTDPLKTNYRFAIYDEAGAKVFDNITADGEALDVSVPLEGGKGRIESGIAKEFKAQDGIYWTYMLTDSLYKVFRHAIPVLACSAAVLIFLIIYLARVAGRRPGAEGPAAGWQEKIPFDIYLAVVGLGLFGLGALAAEASRFIVWSDLPLYILLDTACIAGAAILCTALWMTFCARVKLGKWWRNTLIFQVLRFLFLAIKWFFRGIGRVISGIPLVWKTALGAALLTVYSLLILIFAMNRVNGAAVVMWILAAVTLFPLAIICALQLRRLQSGGAALAAGDLGARIDTAHMFRDFKRHGENLNDISRGMERAVDQQLRSERLKTELITNVSHDIKTPLTSIINYVDLLKKDDGGQSEEYLEVLDRQSRRLKKLTEDLVEMSKASSGNIPVNASRRSANELLSQAVGEYSEKFAAAELEPVLTLPEEELFVWADGTLVWRILDNIFSNACKYALRGTRFYISAAEQGGKAVMSFKNVSREKLNISADELMERFVRGDAARTGEGSGLGLNIAKSLAELQGGSLELAIDGDLFRADVTLPKAA